ncbi:hypothetical protein CUJ86_01800 [Methanofollis fontis]|uniref:Uncharacterized protein n=2 Tax=Methanofollis fontis TaxID=2052832 RepID=A0A483CVF5_9EURY|nr:hypothetical protein CUJ86_01800 [Methanofollis fontis]
MGCVAVLLLVVTSPSLCLAFPSFPADPNDPSMITVTVVDASEFVEVPGYVFIMRNGPIDMVHEDDPSSVLRVAVYSVKAAEDSSVVVLEDTAAERAGGYAGCTAAPEPTASLDGVGEDNHLNLPFSSNTLPLFPDFGSRSRYYLLDVESNTTCFWVDLVWKDPERPLGLTIYHPDGVLGTYDDTSDGKEDGRIYLRISNEAGIAQGKWFLKISGSRPFTSSNYAFSTYLW